jgi:hypothetical protein
MSMVAIGIDPYKCSAMVEAMASDEPVLGWGRY